MKTFNIKLFVLTLTTLFAGITASAQVSKAEIIATGLTCSMCSNAINKQLEAMPIVDHITTDLNTNTFSVFFKPEAAVQPNTLKDAVEKAGFFVGSMVLTVKVDSDKISETGFNLDNNSYIVLDKKGTEAGEAKFRVLDKGFVTQKEFKKLSKTHSKTASYKEGAKNNYHVQAI